MNDQDMTFDENTLIMAAQKGDWPAFSQLLTLYEKKIYSHLYRIVNRREDAEDLTQETFLKVYRHFRSFNPEKKFSTWLYTIATRTAYDWLRKQRRANELFLIDDEESSFETIDPLETYKNIDERHDLDIVLSSIKTSYRTILLLYYREGFTYEEIAATLNIPINTVKTNIRRAKLALRNAIEGQTNYS